jgi:hypothetical protein
LGKKEKLAKAIRERISEEELDSLRRQLAGRLVGITVAFLLWKGSPNVSNTRPVRWGSSPRAKTVSHPLTGRCSQPELPAIVPIAP